MKKNKSIGSDKPNVIFASGYKRLVIQKISVMDIQILNPLRWSKWFLYLILGGFILIWFTFIDTYSLWTRYRLSQRYDALQTKTEQLQTDTKQLQQKIHHLKNDPALLERIAREEYGMKKKNETVYKINEK